LFSPLNWRFGYWPSRPQPNPQRSVESRTEPWRTFPVDRRYYRNM
jgi:hypothetical protein